MSLIEKSPETRNGFNAIIGVINPNDINTLAEPYDFQTKAIEFDTIKEHPNFEQAFR